MQELKLTAKNYVQVLQAALEVVRGGGTIVYPTETSYGLGADYYNSRAVKKIYLIKRREARQPLPVLVSDLVSASSLVEFTEKSRRLAAKYWPGPLTLILPFSHQKWQKHFDKYLALRVSSHPFASSLTINLGHPLVATSANISGQGDCYTPTEVRRQFKGQKYQPDLFINGGTLPRRRPTSIVKCDADKYEIVRQGELKIKI